MSGELTDECWQKVKEKLALSPFRTKFRLKEKEKAYVKDKGFSVLRQHACDFVASRLAPAFPNNDGRQTPMKGHPVFIAQHATATCCRSCLNKWHNVSVGRSLTITEQEYVVAIIMRWIEEQIS